MKKIKVIKEAYYVSEDLTSHGMIDKDEFESSFSQFLVVGDVWELKTEENGFEYFKCIKGKWKGEENEGWWDYEDNKDYFEIIE